jgi:uncharacterized RDD family membrane protein YckC/DnaJ-domain-containing protein 1
MTWWNTLGLKPDADEKSIKIAYAKLLKENKPDENPSGFQQLHRAYKDALKATKLRINTQIMFDEYEFEEEPDDQLDCTDVWEQAFTRERPAKHSEVPQEGLTPEREPPQEPIETEPDQNEALSWQQRSSSPLLFINNDPLDSYELDEIPSQLDCQALLNKIEELMDNEEACNDLDHWNTLLSGPLMDTLDYKVTIREFIFNKLINLPNERYIKFSLETLVTLDTVFRWTEKRRPAYASEEKPAHRAFIKRIDDYRSHKSDTSTKHQSNKEILNQLYLASRFRRAGSFTVDIIFFLLGLILLIVIMSTTPERFHPLIAVGIFLWLFVISIFESSPLQASPGMLLFKHKLVKLNGTKAGFFQVKFRFTLLLICLVTAKFTAFINLFLKDSRMLHDRLTGTAVILRRTKIPTLPKQEQVALD